MEIEIFQLHKRSSYEYGFIQDKYAVKSRGEVFSIADGTTQSFRSEIWSEIITNTFVNNPVFDKTIIDLFKSNVIEYDSKEIIFSTNPAMASLETEKRKKGATSTFIGGRIDQNDILSLISVGDSNAFILSHGKIETFPHKTIEQLDECKFYLNTERLKAEEVDESYFTATNIPVKKGDQIILATDALSRLLLKRIEYLNSVLKWGSFKDFYDFCLDKWESKEMEEDDITALVITVTSRRSIHEFTPSKEHIFPKEKEMTFVPSPIIPSNNPKYDDMKSNYMHLDLDEMSNEIIKIKRRLKLHFIALIALFVLLFISIIFTIIMYNFQHNKVFSPSPSKAASTSKKQ